MATSQNGYSANDRSVVSRRLVPGTNVALTVRNGAPGDLLLWVLSQFDRRVEDLDMDSTRGEDDDWGYAERPIRGSISVLSNHASGTAVDANATRHPLGVANTFTSTQKAAIRQILAECQGCVRWGGDFDRPDEMHFEIVKGPADCERVLHQLTAVEDDMEWTDGPLRHGRTGTVLPSFGDWIAETNLSAGDAAKAARDAAEVARRVDARLAAMEGSMTARQATLLAAIHEDRPVTALIAPEQLAELRQAIREAQSDEAADAAIDELWRRLAPPAV